MFGKVVGSSFAGNTSYYYMIGETRLLGRGPGTIAEAQNFATRIYGSQSYYFSATAAGTGGYGSFWYYTTADTIHTSHTVEITDGYTNLEHIVKPATNCTKVQATFGFFDQCDFNGTFKTMFMRSFLGTGADAQLGTQHLIGIAEIDLIGLDPNNTIELYQQSFALGSYDISNEDAMGTWCATLIYVGTHNLSSDICYPTQVHLRGSIAYTGVYYDLGVYPIEDFLDGKPVIAVNDIVRATIYVEF
jgi:hypothetical protein